MLLNKIDLLPYVDFDLDTAKNHARRVNKDLAIYEVSCRTGEGLGDWYHWLERERQAKKGA